MRHVWVRTCARKVTVSGDSNEGPPFCRTGTSESARLEMDRSSCALAIVPDKLERSLDGKLTEATLDKRRC